MTFSSTAGGLHWVDYLVVAGYVLGMIAIGWWHGRRQDSATGYFVGGHRMGSAVVGISLFATLLSTISYLSTPGEMIKHGPVLLTGVVSLIPAYFIVAHLLIPRFIEHGGVSAYGLLERNLGVSVRLTGAVMFILLRVMWMAALIYMASSALIVVLGLSRDWLFAVTLVTGTVAIAYSSLGGLRAVVMTDVAQFVILFSGALLVIVIVTVRLGGIQWFPTAWDPGWDSQPLFSLDPHVRLTVIGTIVMQTLWWVCTAGGDQTAVQRYLATRDVRAARRSFLVSSLANLMVLIVLSVVGFALLGYYTEHPESLGDEFSIVEQADMLFPAFVSGQLPIGVSGLVVAGMFAAAMSSIDSGVNSISAVLFTDFMDRFGWGNRNGARVKPVRTARILAVVIGCTVIGLSGLIEYVPGNFLEVSKRTLGLLAAPIFLLFFMALFVPFATAAGTILGALTGFMASILVAYWEPITGLRQISFQYIYLASLTVGAAVACSASGLERIFRAVQR